MTYEQAGAEPIPLEVPSVAGWKELPLTENGEALTALGPFSAYDDIFTSSVYYGEHTNSPYLPEAEQLDGSLITMFVRRGVAESLRAAQRSLPPHHYLIVLDSYRSLSVQQSLYDHYFDGLAALHTDWSPEELSAETQKYVSIPSVDPSRPSPHNTGGAVDLAVFRLPPDIDHTVQEISERLTALRRTNPSDPTPWQEAYDPGVRAAYLLEMERIGLIRRHAEFLNFGTRFDHGGPEAALNYFERLGTERTLTAAEEAARANRRMLYRAMTASGLQPYEEEWWHYNAAESQMGAMTAGLPEARYGAIELSADDRQHEMMRRMHYRGLIRIHESLLAGEQLPASDDMWSALLALNGLALSRSGDPRISHLPRAAVIAPNLN